MLRHTSFHPTESTADTHELPRLATTRQQQEKQHKNRRAGVSIGGGWTFKGCMFLLSLMWMYWQSKNPLNNDTSRFLAETTTTTTPTIIDKKTAGWDMINSDATIGGICRGRNNLVEFDDSVDHNNSTNNNIRGNAKWTIVMTVNDGFYDFFQNWYHHFEKLGLQNNNDTELVLFAEDAHVYEKLTRQFPVASPKHPQRQSSTSIQKVMVIPTHLEKVTGANQDQSFSFGNWKYVTLVAKRPTRMLSVLCTGRNVLYVDADTVWKSNPLVHLKEDEEAQQDATTIGDTTATTRTTADGYMIVDWKTKKLSHGYSLCTGFMAIKANRYGLEWIHNWEKGLIKEDLNQGVWNMVYSEFYKFQRIEPRLKGAGEKSHRHVVRPLSSALFPSGRDFFQTFTQEQRDSAIHVHANFMTGHDTKKKKLQEHGLWAAVEQP
jgi:hypothetical protein